MPDNPPSASLRLHVGDLVEVVPDSWAPTGEVRAIHEGRALFVDEGIPGERIEARVFRRHRRETWAQAEKILDPSLHRDRPPCSMFGICGGCQWQHLSGTGQQKAKAELLAAALRSQGLEHPVEAFISPSPALGYRTKAEQELAVREGHVVWGIHQQRGWRIAEGKDCLIHRPGVHALVNALGALLDKPEHLRLVAQHRNKGGPLRGFMVRASSVTGEALVVFFTGPGDIPELEVWAGELSRPDFLPFQAQDQGPAIKVVGVLRNISSLESGTLYGPETVCLRGKSEIWEESGGLRYLLGFEDFFQSSPEAALALQKEVLSSMPPPPTGVPGDRPAAPILDLYSGVGFFGLALARMGHGVVCVEYKPSSLIRALKAAAEQGIKGVSAVAGKAEKIMRGFAARKARFSALVVDPPRPGIHQKALEAMLELRCPRIVYVSCNPVTLARDLRVLLDGGYRLLSVKGFDLFPQTRHLEAVAVLDRPGESPLA